MSSLIAHGRLGTWRSDRTTAESCAVLNVLSYGVRRERRGRAVHQFLRQKRAKNTGNRSYVFGQASASRLRSRHMNMVKVSSMLGGLDQQPLLVHTIPHEGRLLQEAAERDIDLA